MIPTSLGEHLVYDASDFEVNIRHHTDKGRHRR